MKRLLFAALVLLVCGASASIASPAEIAQNNKRKSVTHTVTIDATSFKPETLTIKAGDTVIWINKDFIPHTASSKDSGFDSGTILAGESWRHTFKSKGKAPYTCLFHPTMKATLRIE